jgi:hypothetical protein
MKGCRSNPYGQRDRTAQRQSWIRRMSSHYFPLQHRAPSPIGDLMGKRSATRATRFRPIVAGASMGGVEALRKLIGNPAAPVVEILSLVNGSITESVEQLPQLACAAITGEQKAKDCEMHAAAIREVCERLPSA